MYEDTKFAKRVINEARPKTLIEIVDIGASMLKKGTYPYDNLIDLGLARLTGFEPNQAEFERFEQTETRKFLPYAMGDGSEMTLKIRNRAGFTSVYDNSEMVPHIAKFWRHFRTAREEKIVTKRLDDITEIDRIDHLKIDVQGLEAVIFENGKNKLADTLSVQTEVALIALYKDQPMFADQDQVLRSVGLQFFCFVDPHMFSFARFPNLGDRRVAQGDARQWVDADAVYLRDFTTWLEIEEEKLRKLLMLCIFVHHSRSAAAQILSIMVERGMVKQGLMDDFVEALEDEKAGRL